MSTAPVASKEVIEQFLSSGPAPWDATYSLELGVSPHGYTYLNLVARSGDISSTLSLGTHPGTPTALAEALLRAAARMPAEASDDRVTWYVQAGVDVEQPAPESNSVGHSA